MYDDMSATLIVTEEVEVFETNWLQAGLSTNDRAETNFIR